MIVLYTAQSVSYDGYRPLQSHIQLVQGSPVATRTSGITSSFLKHLLLSPTEVWDPERLGHSHLFLQATAIKSVCNCAYRRKQCWMKKPVRISTHTQNHIIKLYPAPLMETTAGEAVGWMRVLLRETIG